MKLYFSLLLHILYIFAFNETIHRLPEKFHDSETEGWRVWDDFRCLKLVINPRVWALSRES